MKNLEQLVLNDYQQNNIYDFVEINFLKKISKSKIFITPTGLVCHTPNVKTMSILKKWENNIYSKKINPEKLQYTSNNAIMRSRHYYSAIFINELLLKKKQIKFCDFGSGEGNFIFEMSKINKDIKFYFTEHSKKNYKNIKNKYKGKIIGFNGMIEDCISNKNFKKLDVASLLYTLCNCLNPINVLDAIYSTLSDNGLLLITESSRILVPFKKPIYNFFNSKIETKNTHPWFFSFNSLSNLLEICGFEIIKHNRFYDENDLVVVARKKNKKTHHPKIIIDNPKKVISYLKQWKNNSIFLQNKVF